MSVRMQKALEQKGCGNLSEFGYSQYNVSTSGQITNVTTGQVLKPFIDRRGYENFSLWGDDGTRKTLRGHQLVARKYIPNPDNLPQVDHLDGNKRNNSVENLEWVTNRENNLRARANGLMVSPNTYPKELVHEVCEYLERGFTMYEIAEDLGVPKNFVFGIKHRLTHINESWGYDF